MLLSGAASAAPRLGPIGPAASAADLAPLADLLALTGWQPTPEFSDVFSPGAVFSKAGGQHRLLATDCVEAAVVAHAYPSVDLVRSLQTGVSVRWGVGRARADAALVRRMTFGAPTRETLRRWSVSLTEDCRTRLQQLPPGERSAVQHCRGPRPWSTHCRGAAGGRGRRAGVPLAVHRYRVDDHDLGHP